MKPAVCETAHPSLRTGRRQPLRTERVQPCPHADRPGGAVRRNPPRRIAGVVPCGPLRQVGTPGRRNRSTAGSRSYVLAFFRIQANAWFDIEYSWRIRHGTPPLPHKEKIHQHDRAGPDQPWRQGGNRRFQRMGRNLMRTITRQATEWLAAAATDPRDCERQWHGESGVAALPCGRLWDVLSVPEAWGVLALDALLRLPRAPGPVLTDTGAGRVGFFLPHDPAGRWLGTDVRYLGKGAWVTVPAPHQAVGRLHWLVPPDGAGTLCVPAAVETALQQALGTLTTRSATRRRCPVCGARTAQACLPGKAGSDDGHRSGRRH